MIGQEVDTSLSTRGTDMRVERVVVTNEHVLGKKIRDLQVKERYDVVISRLNRAGVELVASPEASLQFGDILNRSGVRRPLTPWRIWSVTLSKTAAGPNAAGVYRYRAGRAAWLHSAVYRGSRWPSSWVWRAGR